MLILFLLAFAFLSLSAICYTLAGQVTPMKAHPYLFYTPQRTEWLKERIKTDTLLASRWMALQQRCDGWIAEPKGSNMERLAITYTITGDKR